MQADTIYRLARARRTAEGGNEQVNPLVKLGPRVCVCIYIASRRYYSRRVSLRRSRIKPDTGALLSCGGIPLSAGGTPFTHLWTSGST